MICVGSAVVNPVFAAPKLPLTHGKTSARSVVRTGGGPVANAAVTVAALGGHVTLWSRLNDDSGIWRLQLRHVLFVTEPLP